jgi:hypothetical protein
VLVQNCGGAAALATTRTLRIASIVTIDSNRAGRGGGAGVCVIADPQLASASSVGRISSTAAVSGPAPDTCLDGGKESFAAVADATSPFMIMLLTGAFVTVSLCSGLWY